MTSSEQSLSQRVARALLEVRAVFLRPDEPFTWASGIKSPVYCDNRLTLSSHKVRSLIEEGIASTVREHYPDCQALMGTSTAGIPHAAIAAHLLELPMGYVRTGQKDHGRKNQIEGRLDPGQKVVVIEDLISTAGSAIEAAEILRAAGAQVLGIVSIFTYGMQKGLERLREAGILNHSLTDFDTLVELAASENYIAHKDVERLLAFRRDPADESWIGEKR